MQQASVQRPQPRQCTPLQHHTGTGVQRVPRLLHARRAASQRDPAVSSSSPASNARASEQPAPNDTRTQLKSELLATVSRLNNSLVPQQDDLKAFLGLVSALAAFNPTPQPEQSPLMNGRWVLLYTSNARGATAAVGAVVSPEEKLLQAFSPFQALSDILYKVFYSYLPILAGSATGKRGTVPSLFPPRGHSDSDGGTPLVRSRGNFQTFDLTTGSVSNEAKFDLLGVPSSITVLGTAEVVPATRPGLRGRLRAMFTEFYVTVDGQRRLALPLALPSLLRGGALQGPVGYVDTCYLDEQLRISSGDKGSVFITIREGQEPPPGT